MVAQTEPEIDVVVSRTIHIFAHRRHQIGAPGKVFRILILEVNVDSISQIFLIFVKKLDLEHVFPLPRLCDCILDRFEPGAVVATSLKQSILVSQCNHIEIAKFRIRES